MTTGFYIFMGLNFVHGIALVVVFFMFLDNSTAIICLVVLSLAFYWFVQYIMRVRYSNRPIKISDKITITPYRQAAIWNTINGILALTVFIATVVYARTDDEISNFASISIILLMIGSILSLGILGTWISDRTHMNE
jgi:archaellum biogenesis protein FlaJ (TadC family)